MELTIRLFHLSLLMLCFSCVNKTPATSMENIENHWRHSHEEDTDEIRVFRPSTFSFKPSRGREEMILKEDGVLVYTPIAPDDRPRSYDGQWKVNNADLELTYEGKTLKFEIVEVSDSILKLK